MRRDYIVPFRASERRDAKRPIGETKSICNGAKASYGCWDVALGWNHWDNVVDTRNSDVCTFVAITKAWPYSSAVGIGRNLALVSRSQTPERNLKASMKYHLRPRSSPRVIPSQVTRTPRKLYSKGRKSRPRARTMATEAVKRFFSSPHFAVAGASQDHAKYGYKRTFKNYCPLL